MRITDKINFRQPKYMLPAIVYIPLIATGYFVFDMFNTEVAETQDKNLQTTEFLNPNLPGAQIKNGDGIGGKYENMAKSYGRIADYSAVDNIERDNEEEKEAYESKYTEEDLAELVRQAEEKDDAAEVADAKAREAEALEALNKALAEARLRGQAAVAPVAQDTTQAGPPKEQIEVKGQIAEDSKAVKALDEEDKAQVLRGIAPVACMANYQKEVTAYTKGLGKVTFRFAGYYPCHNTEEVVAQTGYDPERDLSHPADSVFCAHGAGFIVPWNEVPDHMHVEGRLLKKKEQQEEAPSGKKTKTYDPDHWIDIEEIDAILARTYHANKHEKGATKQWRTAKKVISGDNAPRYAPVKAVSKEEYLLVDGYNIIFAWESLKELAEVNIDGARGKLLDILCNYQGIKKCNLIVVFDAYRVKGHQTEMLDHHNIHVVYTKEAETADAYIEKFAHENGRKYHVTVATSDGLEQIIITGQGCHLLSAREFEREVEAANQTLRETIDGMREKSSNHILGDALKQLTDEKIQL